MDIHELIAPYHLELASFEKLYGYANTNYKIVTTAKQSYVLKHYTNQEELAIVKAENKILEAYKDFDFFALPQVQYIADKAIHIYGDGSFSRLLSFVPGKLMADVKHDESFIESFGNAAALFNKFGLNIQSKEIESREIVWDLKYALMNRPKSKFIAIEAKRKWVERFFDQFEQDTIEKLLQLPHQIIHNDLNNGNVLAYNHQVSGFIDFGDLVYAPKICEIAIALSYLLMNKKEPLKIAASFLKAYHKIKSISPLETELLYNLIATRLCTSVCNSAEAKGKNTDTDYILQSEKPAWELLEKWIEIDELSAKNAFRIAIDSHLAKA